MAAPRPITDLEVIGYADALTEAMVPSVVPPLFRVRKEPQRVIFPPFTFANGVVWEATEGDEHDLKKLANDGEITLFEKPFPVPAQWDFELWLDQRMEPHYEPRCQADDTLRSIAEANIQQAKAAFVRGDYAEADRLCGAALAADDRLVEALAIMAAVCRRKQDPTGEADMAALAAGTLSAEAFTSLVEACGRAQNATAGPPPPTGPEGQPGDLFQLRPMAGIAAMKPWAVAA